MKFSLILATLNRIGEVEYFLKSLTEQTYSDFELIVVDQNTDGKLDKILSVYKEKIPLLHLHSLPGLSLARNVALPHINGDIVAFPDDDCAYPSNLLENVNHLFKSNANWYGLTGRSISLEGRSTGGRWGAEVEPINFFNVWNRGISYTIFLRKEIVNEVGLFDEKLGVGSKTPWGSAEETDYLIRSLKRALYYNPSITVVHPIKVDSDGSKKEKRKLLTSSFSKTYSYALGRGYVLRKHNAPIWFVFYNWLRPLIGLILCLIKGDFYNLQSYWATFKGRLQGWFGWA